ncbi:hypothetical protein DPMN_107383 [Dreissena polymorpha]|uniref:Uncharacterized protein n=1 Tax=Dreissena polymorpha TaxID=45954 RepID=A0A9D4K6L9_DREPO|nr:hypothetical protein DPMN_107383 [Dreissena polymorpha]
MRDHHGSYPARSGMCTVKPLCSAVSILVGHGESGNVPEAPGCQHGSFGELKTAALTIKANGSIRNGPCGCRIRSEESRIRSGDNHTYALVFRVRHG